MDEQPDRTSQPPDGPPIVPSSPENTVSVAVHQQAHGVTTHNGDLVMAGGNVTIQKNFYGNAETKITIESILRLVRNLRSVHLDILSKATAGTCIWLLKAKYFLLWLDLNGKIKILWGTGIPGAGKSVMASIVINELEARAAAEGGRICVCYVFFRYSDVALTIRDVLEILVKQTIERHPECTSLTEDAYARHLRENTQPTEAELLQLLHRFTGAKLATFYVLDALDEALDRLQLELIITLASLNVRLFITSRPLNSVKSRIPGVHSFSIVAQAQDVDLHIREGIERSPELQALIEKAGPSLKEEIISSIKQNCDGMFLHASLQMDALFGCFSPGEVRRTLEAFPSNIKDVYLHTWNRILTRNPARIALAQAVLVWVLNAASSLTLDQLECAVATSPKTYKFEPDEVVPGTTLLTLCRGLVMFEEESRVVRLVHYTAKAALQELLQESYPHPHYHLSAVCMAHLTACGFQNTTIRSQGEFIAARQADPLLTYASDAWAMHARESLRLNFEEPRSQIAGFVGNIHSFPAFTDPNLLDGFDILGPLHILAMHNLISLAITRNDIDDPNVVTKIAGVTPLMLASSHGHEGAAASFLANPKILVNLVDSAQWSALQHATSHGHENIIKLLLAHPGVQVNSVKGLRWSVLMLAALRGYKGIVKLFLAHPGIQVNLVNDENQSALMEAARRGQQDIIQLLLSHPEIQVNLVNSQRWSALMIAAKEGHEGVVHLLLAHPDIQVNLVTRKGWSALMLASRYGRQGIVAALLARSGTQVNLADRDGFSALAAAANTGQEGCIRLLLAHPEVRAQVNAVSSRGLSALMLAAKSGHEATVRLLLDVPHIKTMVKSTEDGQTAKTCSVLIEAASNGHEGIVQLLLARSDSDVNLLDSNDWSALMAAAMNGHEGVVKLLLAHHAILINLTNSEGWSALMKAARKGRKGVIAIFLAHPMIQVNLVDNRGWSALMISAGHDRAEACMLLLEHPAIEVNLVDLEGQSALLLAARYGCEGIVKSLLAHSNIRVNLADNTGCSALMLAASFGHEDVSKLILAHPDVQVNLLDNNGWSALMLAAKGGHISIVRLLLDVPHIEAVTRGTQGGHSAVSIALDKGHLGIVHLLQEFSAGLRLARSSSVDSGVANTVVSD